MRPRNQSAGDQLTAVFSRGAAASAADIANTDVHTGNLSFRPQAQLELAPAYDMLPMLYAPLPNGEVPALTFEPPPPLPPREPPGPPHALRH